MTSIHWHSCHISERILLTFLTTHTSLRHSNKSNIDVFPYVVESRPLIKLADDGLVQIHSTDDNVFTWPERCRYNSNVVCHARDGDKIENIG